MIRNMIRIGSMSLAMLISAATAFSFCSSPEKKDLVPDEKQIEVCRQVVYLVSNFNYKKVPLDDSLSRLVYDAYLKNMDGNRVYFLAADVEQFNSLRDKLDDYLQVGELQPAYNMFNLYLDRYVNRVQFMIDNLESQPYVFEGKEALVFNREKAKWFSSMEEMDAYWINRIKYDLLNLKLTGSEEAKSKETLKKRYQNLLTQVEKLNSYDAFQSFMSAYTESVDPHTNYFNPSNAANFNIDMSRSLEGIGATLRMDNEYVTVNAIVPGGPAYKSNLISIDDKLVAVAQGKDGEFTDIIGWRLDNAIQLIRGAKGTTVRLKIISKGQDMASPKIIELVREKIILQDQSAKKSIKEIEQNGKKYKIGIIDVPAFYMDFKAYQAREKNYKSTSRDVNLILDSLKNEKVDAIVVDLRGNTGGSLMEAIDLTGLFIKTGPVVQVRDTKDGVEVESDNNSNVSWDGPLAVMIDRFSASASEIFAGAIQDYGRGLILGTQSFGKGTVQNSIDLDQVMGSGSNKVVGKENTYGQINLTVAKFYRISGSSNQHKGIMPDLSFPMLFPADKYGESAEPAALPWDEIKKSNYKPVGNLSEVINIVEKKHQKRMKSSKEYSYLLEDIKEFSKREEEKSVVLNETSMKKEREDNDKKNLDRDNERRQARGLEPLKKGEAKPKGEKPYDFLLEESCLIVGDMLSTLKK